MTIGSAKQSKLVTEEMLDFGYFEPSITFTLNCRFAMDMDFVLLMNGDVSKSDKFIDTKELQNYCLDDTSTRKMMDLGIDIESIYSSMNSTIYSSPESKSRMNLRLCKFKDQNYVLLDDLFMTDIYNEVRLNDNEQSAEVTKKYTFDIIKSIDETFRNADVINGYIVVIQWASRSFLSESPRHQNHTLMYICDKAFVKQLINYDITEQEFLDKVIILGKTGLRGENRTNIQLN